MRRYGTIWAEYALWRALALAPERVEIMAELALALAEDGAGIVAEGILHQCIGLDPTNPRHAANLARLKLRREAWREAIVLILGAIRQDEDHAEYAELFAHLLIKTRFDDEFLRNAFRATILRHLSSETLIRMSDYFVRSADARELYARALCLSPELPGASYGMAEAALRLGRAEEAASWYRAALAAETSERSRTIMTQKLSLALRLAGRPDEAAALWDKPGGLRIHVAGSIEEMVVALGRVGRGVAATATIDHMPETERVAKGVLQAWLSFRQGDIGRARSIVADLAQSLYDDIACDRAAVISGEAWLLLRSIVLHLLPAKPDDPVVRRIIETASLDSRIAGHGHGEIRQLRFLARLLDAMARRRAAVGEGTANTILCLPLWGSDYWSIARRIGLRTLLSDRNLAGLARMQTEILIITDDEGMREDRAIVDAAARAADLTLSLVSMSGLVPDGLSGSQMLGAVQMASLLLCKREDRAWTTMLADTFHSDGAWSHVADTVSGGGIDSLYTCYLHVSERCLDVIDGLLSRQGGKIGGEQLVRMCTRAPGGRSLFWKTDLLNGLMPHKALWLSIAHGSFVEYLNLDPPLFYASRRLLREMQTLPLGANDFRYCSFVAAIDGGTERMGMLNDWRQFVEVFVETRELARREPGAALHESDRPIDHLMTLLGLDRALNPGNLWAAAHPLRYGSSADPALARALDKFHRRLDRASQDAVVYPTLRDPHFLGAVVSPGLARAFGP
jgi:tetratricopeptide (TPR) repeat protein